MGDLLFECRRAADADAFAVAIHCHAQGGLHAVLVGPARDFQAVAIVADGGRADAIDDRALLRHAVLLCSGRLGPQRPRAGHGVALEALGSIAGAQRP